MWAARCVHEASLHEFDRGNSFITLTYSDEHVPYDGSLVKEHFQKFIKRLRRRVEYSYEKADLEAPTIRYFMCGEYGTDPSGGLGRPHYHALLFNQDFSRDELVGVQNDVPLFRSDFLDSCWQKGFASFGTLTYQSARS